MSDIAYNYRRWSKNPKGDDKLFSWEDVWEETLAACGYDAALFRENFGKRHPLFLEE